MATPVAVARSGGASTSAAGLLERGWSRVLGLPSWVLLSTLTVAVLLKTGFGVMPNIANQSSFAAHPMHNALPSEHSFIWWNWLSPATAHVLGLTDQGSYGLFCMALSLAVLPAMYLALRSFGLDLREARWRTVLVCTLPASFTTLFWVGMDSMTLLLLVLVVAVHRRLLASVALGVLCGLQHAEQSLVAIALLGFALWLYERRQVRNAAAALGGVLTGKVVLMLLVGHVSGDKVQTRWDWFVAHHANVLHEFVSAWPMVVWSVFGAGWLVLLGARLGRREWLLVAVAFAAGLAMTITSGDPTRVASITTLPAMLVLLSRASFSAELLRSRLIITLALLAPAVWVWSAHNQTPFPYYFLDLR